ncbi:MAG: pseudouridine synthase [Reichenbachiella sp.]
MRVLYHSKHISPDYRCPENFKSGIKPMQPDSLKPESFTSFKNPINTIDVPSHFTYPFFYKPNPLAKLAANELQEQLHLHSDWQHDADDNSTSVGIMLGVLVVQNQKGQIGYLSAFSGQTTGSRARNGTRLDTFPSFVPPIVDQRSPTGLYQKGQTIISGITEQIASLENDSLYQEQVETFEQMTSAFAEKTEAIKLSMKIARQARKVKRNAAQITLSPKKYKQCCEELKIESLDRQHALKKIKIENEQALAKQQQLFNAVHTQIETLKNQVADKSEALQEALNTEYSFLNASGISKNRAELFSKAPAGTGDCVTPKLLNYAFANNYTPICFAQFWWGHSPIQEMRKHGYFYPACHGRCKPVLTHMLSETPTDPDPILKIKSVVKEIDTVYEDDAIAIINKPYNLISETGNDGSVSVESILKKKYPNATGPLLAHRLDMATSGLMIIVKNIKHYRHLQKQFINRTIKKSYIALVDGNVSHLLKNGETTGTIDLPLRVDIINKPNQVVCYESGKTAVTQWSILKKWKNQTRVLFEPVTGRTHQLRVHAAHKSGLNAPILGDTLYGKHHERLYLHAYSVTFVHPVSLQQVSFTVDPDF